MDEDPKKSTGAKNDFAVNIFRTIHLTTTSPPNHHHHNQIQPFSHHHLPNPHHPLPHLSHSNLLYGNYPLILSTEDSQQQPPPQPKTHRPCPHSWLAHITSLITLRSVHCHGIHSHLCHFGTPLNLVSPAFLPHLYILLIAMSFSEQLLSVAMSDLRLWCSRCEGREETF